MTLGLMALGAPAWAEPIRDAEAPAPERPGAHVHDGFYLRFGTGFGVYDERLSSGSNAAYGGTIEGRSRGIGSLGEFSLGGTLGRGWVVGGAIYSADLLGATYRSRSDTSLPPPAELDPLLRSSSLIGPFFDYYADPAGGFHYQAALGLALLTPRVFGDSATQQSEYVAVGGGLMLGAGYEWWVADEWSLGVLGRTTLMVLSGEDEANVRWLHVVVTSPGLLVTLTYH